MEDTSKLFKYITSSKELSKYNISSNFSFFDFYSDIFKNILNISNQNTDIITSIFKIELGILYSKNDKPINNQILTLPGLDIIFHLDELQYNHV